MSIFDTAGPVAREQVELFIVSFWIALFVLAVVAAGLVYSIVKFRQRGKGDSRMPEQTHGSALFEFIWTTIPVIILIFLAVPTVSTIFRLESHITPTSQDLVVNVTGYQWWWEFEYPELGITTANELHIPTGRRVVLNLISGDVLHSFWVPRLAGKRDLIPNQDNQLWLKADEAGLYFGQCAELCLGPHAYMRLRVIASDEAKFEEWVDLFQQADTQQVQAQAGNPQIETGKALFKTKGCAACHAISGYAYGQRAPDLTNFGIRNTLAAGVLQNTPENLAKWLRDPQAVKPGNYMPDLWAPNDPEREEQISALVAYLESLGQPDQRSASAQGGR